VTPADAALGWTQVDIWRGQQPAAAGKAKLTGPGWRAFADLMPAKGLQEPFRCYAHAADTRIVVRRPCSFVPKKWRAWRVSSKRMCPEGIPAHVWAQVLVALDAWLEGGCRVMRTPVLIREGSTP
jgi:hypothetical protein